jgi:hypothetical protein
LYIKRFATENLISKVQEDLTAKPLLRRSILPPDSINFCIQKRL